MILLTPILLPIIFLLRFTGEGYVFYRQQRIGHKGHPFQVLKFATMLRDSPNMPGGIITTKKDSRLTPLGPFLRKTKMNEIPQLINVIRGEMSLVGPRPLLLESFELYPEDVQASIYAVRPGITGIGSVVFRDEEGLITHEKERGGDIWSYYRNVIYPYKGRLEQWYGSHQSFKVDLSILVLTLLVMVRPNTDLAHKWFKSLPKQSLQ